MDPLEDAGEDSKCDMVHQLLCMACLGPGQTLHVLKHQALQLYNTTVNSGQQLIHNVSPRVCWECEILLMKVIHFRERVTECHDILNSSQVTWSEVTRPSRLQKSTVAEIDIPPLDTESSMSEVKQEIEEVKVLEPSATADTQPPEVKIDIEELDPLETKDIQPSEVKQEIEEVTEHDPLDTEATQLSEVKIEILIEKHPLETKDIEISEVKQEIDLCMGCLCGGRRLNNIRDKELKYYTAILNQKTVVRDVSGVTPRLCWECCCMLRQATLFSEKSVESYQTLLPSLLTADIQDITSLLRSGVSLPPRLRRCVRDRVDIPPHAHTHDPPPPVKLEPGSLGLGDSSPPPAGHEQRTAMDTKRGGGGRGRGRVRGRGRGRGRSQSRGQSRAKRELFEDRSVPSPVPSTSRSSAITEAEDAERAVFQPPSPIDIVLERKNIKAKRVKALPAKLQSEYKRLKAAKELQLFTLPGGSADSGRKRAASARAIIVADHSEPLVKTPTTAACMAQEIPRPAYYMEISPAPCPIPPSPCPLSPSPAPSSLEIRTVADTEEAMVEGVEEEEAMVKEAEDEEAEEDVEGVDLGSDFGDDVPNANAPDNVLTRTALNYPAVLADDVEPRLVAAISRADELNDRVMRNTLPEDCLTFDWVSDISAFHGEREVFTGTPGPTFPISDLTCPVDAFLKYWDADLMEKIVHETNRYAAEYLQKADIPHNSRVKRWRPTDINEMYVFFAVLMHQSISPLTVERDYYYPNSDYTAMPNFKAMMPYARLALLKKFVHFTNNDDIPTVMTVEERRLRKIQPVIDNLDAKFQALFLPGREIAIDESLLKWDGHLSFIQKIATKAAQAGIKSYELCDSKTGYLWAFKIYAGKDATEPVETDRAEAAVDDAIDPPEATAQLQGSEPVGSTAKIVYDLASPLFFKGYTLIMDNFYNSPALARSLKLRKTDCYGTLRLNRENVPESLKTVSKHHMKTRQVLVSTSGDLNIMVWKDVNLVSMISTYHAQEAGAVQKYGHWQHKPQVVLDYNMSMGGVDKKDQLLSSYPVERKRNKIWYKKVFRRLMNVSILNAFVLYQYKNKSIAHRQFRVEVAEGLLKTFLINHPRQVITCYTRCILPSTQRRQSRPILVNNHYSVKITREPYKRRCVWCAMKKKRSRTNRWCNICEVPLCNDDCIVAYHTDVQP